MNAHPSEMQLHDYLDGLLGEAERRVVERHVRACDACRAELQALQALTARLAALPRTIAPETDLLPGIHARIRWGSASASPSSAGSTMRSAAHRHRQGGRTLSLRFDAGRLIRPRVPLAAAALLVIALGAVLALLVTREPAQPPLAAGAGHEPGSLSPAAELRALDARYTAAARELLAELESLEDALPPGTLDIVRENLRAIDRALNEARLATASDPGDPRLARLILAAHEKKLDLLRRAAALSAES
ncbi:MAG TPA: zf-HC2 domain-containing protein [Longimicrobiales bacterium]